MKNIDNRVRYTKMVLQQAMLKILKKKHVDKVTVKELCEEAGINRGTFYLHYDVPNDVLREIEQQFIDEQMSFFSPYNNEGYEKGCLVEIFSGILRNRELCAVIMGKNGNPRFLERIQEMIRANVIQSLCSVYPDYKTDDLNFVFDFVFAGSMKLILRWIEDDKGLTVDDLVSRLDRLGYHCNLAIKEFSKRET